MSRRTGRRPGDSGARLAILDAARRHFVARGYDHATIRGIAADAAVDPALVHHYFGTKQELFVQAVQLPFNPGEVVPALIAEGADGIGERLVGLFLATFDSTADRAPFIALIRSVTANEQATNMVREFLLASILGPIAAALGSPDAALRATLGASQMIGLVFVRYIVRLEPLASADHETVIAAVGPTLQRYLTGDLS